MKVYDDSSADIVPADTPDTQIAAAFQAGLMLAELFRSFPFHDAADFALLHDAAVHATATASKAAPYWIGTVPDWAVNAGSALAGIAWLGRPLTCIAAAAAGISWNDEYFEQAIARNFSTVQEASRNFVPVPHGVLETALRREARETVERPRNAIPLMSPLFDGWLDEQLTAYEELTRNYPSDDNSEGEPSEAADASNGSLQETDRR